MALRKYEIGQTRFEVYDPSKNIPENHVCFLLKKIVKREDFSENNEKYLNAPGGTAYDREMLATIVLMGAVDGIFSSRRLAELTYRDDIYKYLSGMQNPDFRTICRFKIECKDIMRNLYLQTVKFGIEEGIIKLQNISFDGTTMKANASKNKRITQKDIEIANELIEKSIKLDEEEDLLYNEESGEIVSKESMDKIDEKTENYTKIKSSVKKIVNQSHKNKKLALKKLNKAEKKLKERHIDKISLTDPDSFWIPNKKHYFELLYNIQVTYDYESRLIINNRIADNPTDFN
jgi:transposase